MIVYSILMMIPEFLLVLMPFFLCLFGLLSLVEAFLAFFLIVFLFFSACYRKVNFPQFKEGDIVSVVIAPEESSSRFANKFITTACRISQELCEYQYLAIGTPSLVKNTEIELFHDISDDAVWGLPNLWQLLTLLHFYRRLSRFIIRNQKYLRNVILYSSPDLAYRLFRRIRKKMNGNIRFIATGLPEKELISGIVGIQAKSLVRNSHRLILPFSGGVYNDYYKSLAALEEWDRNKFFRCQSSLVLEYLENAKETSLDLDQNNDVLMLIGARETEARNHLSIAQFVLNRFEGTKFRVVFLCPNEKLLMFLKNLFSDYKCATFELDDSYDYSKARLAICKSGTALLKPVLYGIPTIPFYLPNFRTKSFIRLLGFWRNKVVRIGMEKAYFLLPNLITKSKFLSADFLGSMNYKALGAVIDSYMHSPPDTEAFRVHFAQEFLEIEGDNIGFSEIVEQFIENSKKNIKTIKQLILKDSQIELQAYPDPEAEFNEINRKLSDEYLSAYRLWSKHGRTETFIRNKLEENRIRFSDSDAIIISSGLADI